MLATECLPCHGGKKTSSGLAVGSREALLKGGDRGPAIVAGEPDKSLLIQAIRRTHDEVKMPPKKRLADEAVADLARWIAEGAAWPTARAARPRARGNDARDPALGVRAGQGRRAAARPDRLVRPADRSIRRRPAPRGRTRARAPAPTAGR